MNENYQEQIKELIINDSILEAIELFYNEEDRSEVVNEIIIIKSNLISLQNKTRARILSFDEESRALNKIKYDLLNLISRAKSAPRDKNVSLEKDTFSFDKSNLDSAIEKLTKDQYVVLNFINRMKKVRISGCAGSGKTLVASEKAIRLSQSGLKVIVLCHNPMLCTRIKSLVAGSKVFTNSFGQLIQNLNDYKSLHQTSWNKYHEPLQEELNKALTVIEENNIRFDAVIVDEAQDFREEWWIVVDALLSEEKNEQILYIFHDDNQALLPNRAVYPIDEPVIDLSKNCRNGGKIFEFIKSNFHYQAPEPSFEIKIFGEVKLFVYSDRITIVNRVFSALDWIINKKRIKKPVVLLAGDINISHWEFGYVSSSVPIGLGWKKEIIDKFIQIGFNNDIIQRLKQLSENQLPTEKDIILINEIANQEIEKIHMEHVLSKIGVRIAKSDTVNWADDNGKSVIKLEHEDPAVMKYFLLKFLAANNWAMGLQRTIGFYFSENIDNSNDEIPVFETSSFKGMEADGVIIVSRGQSFSYLNELYVASSRAKQCLAIVVERTRENFIIP